MLYTHLGEITVDGEAVFFEESLKGAFSRAGLSVDQASGRRLLGIVEIIGFFNKLNKLSTEEANQSSTQSAVISPMPLTFVATLSQIQGCTGINCLLGGALVDWASVTPEYGPSLITNQELLSLTFGGRPFASTKTTKDQWPNQSLVVLQNMTHSLSLQTYEGVNYYCSLTYDDSLEKAFEARRRKLRLLQQGAAPFTFLGFVTINGVYCKHFRLTNTSFDIYEDYFQKRLYQIQTSLLIWRFENLTSILNEASNPLTEAHFDFEHILQGCDPPLRIFPSRIKDGKLTNTILPQPDWGILINPNASSASTAMNLSRYNFSLSTANTSSSKRAMKNLNMFAPSERFEVVHPSTHEEYQMRKLEHLRYLKVGSGCGLDSFAQGYPPENGLFSKNSLFLMEYGYIYPCTIANLPNTNLPAIAQELHLSASGGECPEKEGDLYVYLPIGPGSVIIQGSLTFDINLEKCLASFLPKYLSSLLGSIFDISAGMTIKAEMEELEQQACPSCGGFVTSPHNDCWLKTPAFRYAKSNGRPDRTSWLPVNTLLSDVGMDTSVQFTFDLRPGQNYPGFDLNYIQNMNSRSCWITCWSREDCGGATFTVDGQCWIKTSLAFTPQNEINVQGMVSIIKRKFLPAANTDCWGSDLQHLSGQSVLNCQQACMGKNYAAMLNPALPKCGGFVTSPSQDCWLKNYPFTCSQSAANNNRVSWLPPASQGGYLQNQNYPSYDLQYSANTDWLDCWTLCVNRIDCGGATFDFSGNCWIKSANAYSQGNLIIDLNFASIVKDPFFPVPNTDYSGADLQYFSLSASDCQAACLHSQTQTNSGLLGNFKNGIKIDGEAFFEVRVLLIC